MQSEIALNVQQSIRPGECIDTYYAGKENSMKQCHATVLDNRFFQGLQSLGSGSSSTVTFNPNEGLGEVIVTMTLNPPQTGTGVNLALPVGWGYALLRRIGYRYGSSQLYYINGQQNLVQTLALCEDSGKKQQILYLGGQAITSPADWADVTKRTAYVYLRLPHSSPALAGGSLPFPSDILTAPIQLQIDLQDFNSVISKSGTYDTPPNSLSSGVVNFSQVSMQDAGDLIARRFDMSKHALTIPLPESWTQETVQFPFVTGSDGTFSLSLTGCKAGDLKKLRVWFVNPGDVNPAGICNPNLFYAPSSIQFAINGLIYLASNSSSYLLNNVLRRRTPPAVTQSLVTYQNGAYSTTPVASTWVEIDLAQPHAIGDTGEVALLHGVPVMNSVLSLAGTMPIANQTYQCVVEYNLNCSWMASRGSAEFVF
jgi:hypothetical protein